MVVFDLDRDERDVGLAHPGDFANHLGDKGEQLAVILCKDLDADIRITGGVSNVTDRFIFRQLGGYFEHPGGFHLDEDVRAYFQPKSFSIDIPSYGDYPILDEAVNSVTNRPFANSADARSDL